jgi:hypothetical protein
MADTDLAERIISGWSYTTPPTEHPNRPSLKVSSASDSKHITIEVYEPATGYGADETPSRRATFNITKDTWNELVARVSARLMP